MRRALVAEDDTPALGRRPFGLAFDQQGHPPLQPVDGVGLPRDGCRQIVRRPQKLGHRRLEPFDPVAHLAPLPRLG